MSRGETFRKGVWTSPIVHFSGSVMPLKLTMLYWEGDRYWVGKIPNIPNDDPGGVVEELEENLKDAYMMMVTEDVPESYQLKDIIL